MAAASAPVYLQQVSSTRDLDCIIDVVPDPSFRCSGTPLAVIFELRRILLEVLCNSMDPLKHIRMYLRGGC